MFTGLVESTGIIDKSQKKGNSLLWTITPNKKELFADIKVGESIAVCGTCLTVVELNLPAFTVEVSYETLLKSKASKLSVGNGVNLERAMLANARLDGHIVQGHVDTVGFVSKKRIKGEMILFEVKFDSKYNNLVVEKGSIALDGISLTISKCLSGAVEVSIISHTVKETEIANWTVGYKINIEFDIIGKYIIKAHLK